ncbi:hypothetical protein HanIR_Chr10g0483191 [Helianthus annuus]|nr:hypothetical protein HanIR_Chr10g0483191 [Helianthus annuus]KAJ0697334.1 hypothetical protein HanLR1_Chr10g0367821 [Helianthus annuus]
MYNQSKGCVLKGIQSVMVALPPSDFRLYDDWIPKNMSIVVGGCLFCCWLLDIDEEWQ